MNYPKKKTGPKFSYTIYHKNDDSRWEFIGKFNNLHDASEETGVSINSLSKIIHGIYSIYQENYKVDVAYGQCPFIKTNNVQYYFEKLA